MRVPALHIGGWYDTFLSGLVQELRRAQPRLRPAAEARDRPLVPHRLGAGRLAGEPPGRIGRLACGRRLAAALVRPLPQGGRGDADRQRRQRLRPGRGLARVRRMAAGHRAGATALPALGRQRELRAGRRRALVRAAGRRAPRRLRLRPAGRRAARGRTLLLRPERRADGPRLPVRRRDREDDAGLHQRAARARDRADRRRACHALRRELCRRHRLRGAALRGRPGRLLAQRAGGHRPGPLARLASPSRR